MPLAFPHIEDDIRLRRSPLEEVICQVRFSPILAIPETRPAQFQELIRRRFPEFETEDSVFFQLQASTGVPISTANQQPINRVYKFLDRRRGTTVTLAQDFFALSTTKYVVWEEFASDLSLVQGAMQKIYEPSYATRIGLRYVNVLEPDKLGLSSIEEVVNLLQPELTTLYRAPVWGSPAEMLIQMLIADNEERLAFRMGMREFNNKVGWQLDFDYFQEDSEGIPLDDLVERCHRYHTVIYDAFRWSISEDHIAAFDPIPKMETLP